MHPHRSSALGYASAASALHSRRYGACSAEAAASEAFGLSVGGCIRAWRYFRPYPVVIPGVGTSAMPVASVPSIKSYIHQENHVFGHKYVSSNLELAMQMHVLRGIFSTQITLREILF